MECSCKPVLKAVSNHLQGLVDREVTALCDQTLGQPKVWVAAGHHRPEEVHDVWVAQPLQHRHLPHEVGLLVRIDVETLDRTFVSIPNSGVDLSGGADPELHRLPLCVLH